MLKPAVNVQLRARRSHKGDRFGEPLHKMKVWVALSRVKCRMVRIKAPIDFDRHPLEPSTQRVGYA